MTEEVSVISCCLVLSGEEARRSETATESMS